MTLHGDLKMRWWADDFLRISEGSTRVFWDFGTAEIALLLAVDGSPVLRVRPRLKVFKRTRNGISHKMCVWWQERTPSSTRRLWPAKRWVWPVQHESLTNMFRPALCHALLLYQEMVYSRFFMFFNIHQHSINSPILTKYWDPSITNIMFPK